MFGETYEYKTSLSNLMTNHIKKKISFLKNKKYLFDGATVLDIGSNDGTFLNNLKKLINCLVLIHLPINLKIYIKKE